ncbi:MAG: ureidoglycolate lyase [Candidatus Atribacteria bacterium]|nr:ureidoglycolate lyase [Candidatus Atribacteria bacterium]
MKTVEIKVEALNRESFKHYGDILDMPDSKPDCSNDDLNLWCGISEVKIDQGISQFCWLDVKSKRSFECNNFERHQNTSEAMIPVSGQSIVLVANNSASNLPVRDSVKAFFIDGTKGFNFKPNVWHWLPYPLSSKASFILVFKKGTPDEDLHVIDLNEKLDLSIKIIL